MTEKVFQGRVIIAGDVKGEALVSKVSFNTLATFYNAIRTGQRRAVCGDQDNPYLFNKEVTDKIICMPDTSGSTSAGATWDRVAYDGLAPLAMLFSKQIDSLTAAGLAVAKDWQNVSICAVDELGDSFLEEVNDGDTIQIKNDGTVTVSQR